MRKDSWSFSEGDLRRRVREEAFKEGSGLEDEGANPGSNRMGARIKGKK